MPHFEKGDLVNLIDDPQLEIFFLLTPERDMWGDVLVKDQEGRIYAVNTDFLEVVPGY
jgi:hypothetical protein